MMGTRKCPQQACHRRDAMQLAFSKKSFIMNVMPFVIMLFICDFARV